MGRIKISEDLDLEILIQVPYKYSVCGGLVPEYQGSISYAVIWDNSIEQIVGVLYSKREMALEPHHLDLEVIFPLIEQIEYYETKLIEYFKQEYSGVQIRLNINILSLEVYISEKGKVVKNLH